MKRLTVALCCLLVGGAIGTFVAGPKLQGQSPVSNVPKDLVSYRDVVKKVLPAVVSVQSKPKPAQLRNRPNGEANPRRRAIRPEQLFEDPDAFRRFLEERMQDEEDMPRDAFGSGYIIDPKGVVVTNFHVVDGQDRVKITLTDGREFVSTSIAGDRKNDIAIVRFEPKGNIPHIEFGDSDGMEIGDRVLAVGAPFGLTGSVSQGIISAKGRSGMNLERTVYEDYLQTDAAVNPGNSGGPLVSLDGRVVGMNTAIKSRTGGFQGVSLAISSNVVKEVVEHLMRDGVVRRGYLGVSVAPLDPDVTQELGLGKITGVAVSRVFPNTPASKAGIKNGDIITAINDKPVADGRDLQKIVSHLPLNKETNVRLYRGDAPLVMKVKVEEQPETFGVSTELPQRGGNRGTRPAPNPEISMEKFGMDVSELTPALAKQHGYAEDAKGVVITKVDPGSVAAIAGIRKGMLITKIEKKEVASLKEAKTMLEKAEANSKVFLELEMPEAAGGGVRYIVLRLDGV